ncbi:MAG: hypothetical protein AAFR75_13600, partial [Pseudomonadota bacterium]
SGGPGYKGSVPERLTVRQLVWAIVGGILLGFAVVVVYPVLCENNLIQDRFCRADGVPAPIRDLPR